MTTDKGVDREKLLYKELSYKVRGCFFEVYNKLGPGFKETIYHNALVEEFNLQSIAFESKKKIPITYKDKRVGIYEPDFLVDNKIITEIKSQPRIMRLDELQLYYYLKGTEYRLGFLVNFGAEKLEICRRII